MRFCLPRRRNEAAAGGKAGAEGAGEMEQQTEREAVPGE
jgi:hypothetical protein